VRNGHRRRWYGTACGSKRVTILTEPHSVNRQLAKKRTWQISYDFDF
jgi:hypothetical protein